MAAPAGSVPPNDDPDVRTDEFQLVLKALLDAYQPILAEEARRAQDPKKLTNEALKQPPDCATELAAAERIFGPFVNETVVMALLPSQAREILGPIDRWRWCLDHIRCCIIFGWLVCRRPRNFRLFVYYLYRYWRCVRQVVGAPIPDGPLSPANRQDFETLVGHLARAYKPYLTDQLATVEFTSGLADEIVAGKVDCLEGEEDAAAVFERFLTIDTAPALLGAAAFEQHRTAPWFWFCRCWCLCAIRFGCCLARSRGFIELFWCLLYYWRCLRECFRPLECGLTAPTGCAEESLNATVGGMAVDVIGTATGAGFASYTLEWREVAGAPCADNSNWHTDGFVYPGGGTSGTIPVLNGLLGWLNTTVLPPRSYEIRLCVHSIVPGTADCCVCIQFNLFKKLVYIDRVGGAPVQTPPGPFVSTAPVVSGNPGGVIVPVGCAITVHGSAWVGECDDRKIKCFDLRYGIGCLPGPNDVGFNPASFPFSMLVPSGPVCYTAPDEAGKRAPWNQVIGRTLTTRFVQTTIDLGGGMTIPIWKLQDFCFDSASQLPPCPDPAHACRSGQYTILLQVEDTLGHVYYDTQCVWFDNKPIHAEFCGIEGLGRCEDMALSKFAPFGGPCGVAWPVNALGIAFDELIDPSDSTYPSDNFDLYTLSITKQGGPTYTVPITPDLITFGPDPFAGTSRVGEPGTRCEEAIGGCPPPMHGGRFCGVLTKLDMRIFDNVCGPGLPFPFTPPAGFGLDRPSPDGHKGSCCGYVFQLFARDKTRSDCSGNCHYVYALPWPVCICNDLSPVSRGVPVG